MLIKEILDMTKEKQIVDIVKDDLLIGEKKLRETLKKIGARFDKREKVWRFEGNPEDLEKSIYDFAKPTKITTARTKEQSNNVSRETLSRKNKENKKRASFDLDIELLKKIKLQSVQDDVNISQFVESVLLSFFEKKR